MPSWNEETIRAVLRNVLDPELGINIVDLGLIYEIKIDENNVAIEMTMTAPACPMGGYLQEQVQSTLTQSLEDVGQVNVEIVWSPRWTPERMSEEAKHQLGW